MLAFPESYQTFRDKIHVVHGIHVSQIPFCAHILWRPMSVPRRPLLVFYSSPIMLQVVCQDSTCNNDTTIVIGQGFPP